MSYRITAAIAEHPPFQARVRACLIDQAEDVVNEAPGSGGGDGDDGGQPVDASFQASARRKLAVDVTVDDSAGKADDSALAFICSSNWSRVARWRMSGRGA